MDLWYFKNRMVCTLLLCLEVNFEEWRDILTLWTLQAVKLNHSIGGKSMELTGSGYDTSTLLLQSWNPVIRYASDVGTWNIYFMWTKNKHKSSLSLCLRCDYDF